MSFLRTAGQKSKTNVITTKTMERSTETELKGLLKDEPAINFGGGRGTSHGLRSEVWDKIKLM